MYVLLNISNVIRKRGVIYFYFLPIMVALTSWGFQFILDKVASIADGVCDTVEAVIGLDSSFSVWPLELVEFL